MAHVITEQITVMDDLRFQNECLDCMSCFGLFCIYQVVPVIEIGSDVTCPLKGHSHVIWDKKLMFNIRLDY